MNTLPRAITAQFFNTPEDYRALQKHWRSLVNSERKHTLSAAHHLLYLALLGKDWRRGFTPPTNRRKLENGAFAGWALFRALQTLRNRGEEPSLLAPFDGLVTLPMLQQMRALIPSLNSYAYKPEDFANYACPFDAYPVEASAVISADKELAHGR
jgi:hypothetical protein